MMMTVNVTSACRNFNGPLKLYGAKIWPSKCYFYQAGTYSLHLPNKGDTAFVGSLTGKSDCSNTKLEREA